MLNFFFFFLIEFKTIPFFLEKRCVNFKKNTWLRKKSTKVLFKLLNLNNALNVSLFYLFYFIKNLKIKQINYNYFNNNLIFNNFFFFFKQKSLLNFFFKFNKFYKIYFCVFKNKKIIFNKNLLKKNLLNFNANNV